MGGESGDGRAFGWVFSQIEEVVALDEQVSDVFVVYFQVAEGKRVVEFGAAAHSGEELVEGESHDSGFLDGAEHTIESLRGGGSRVSFAGSGGSVGKDGGVVAGEHARD